MTDVTTSDRRETLSVDCRLFADLAEAADTSHLPLDLPVGATVSDAVGAAAAADDALAAAMLEDGALRSHLTVLRNGRRVDDLDTILSSGDELAFMPPVSGG